MADDGIMLSVICLPCLFSPSIQPTVLLLEDIDLQFYLSCSTRLNSLHCAESYNSF